MGNNNGSGQPNNLRCAKCKRGHVRGLGHKLRATGHTRPLPPSLEGRGGIRVMNQQAEYECLDCGHVGWSRHKDMQRLLRRLYEIKGE